MNISIRCETGRAFNVHAYGDDLPVEARAFPLTPVSVSERAFVSLEIGDWREGVIDVTLHAEKLSELIDKLIAARNEIMASEVARAAA